MIEQQVCPSSNYFWFKYNGVASCTGTAIVDLIVFFCDASYSALFFIISTLIVGVDLICT